MFLFVTLALANAAMISKLPQAVRSDIEYSREMCRSLGHVFQMKEDFIEENDFNNDGKPDYIMDTRGFDCGKKIAILFNSRAGTPLYVYLSNKEGKWDKIFNAYVYEYQVKKDYGQLPYFEVWVRGEVGYQVVHQRFQWDGKKMAIIKQEIGTEVPKQMWKKFD